MTHFPAPPTASHVLVPIEPTQAMLEAALDCQDADPEDGPAAEMYHAYKAMLAASPVSQGEQPALAQLAPISDAKSRAWDILRAQVEQMHVKSAREYRLYQMDALLAEAVHPSPAPQAARSAADKAQRLRDALLSEDIYLNLDTAARVMLYVDDPIAPQEQPATDALSQCDGCVKFGGCAAGVCFRGFPVRANGVKEGARDE